MGVIGKIIGGAIGFAMGGPLGAVAGAAFGHVFDKSKMLDERAAGHDRLSYSEEAQLTFFVAAFSMLAKLARADGQITDDELNSVSQFMHHDLNLDAQSRTVAMNTFNAALDSPVAFQDFAGQFYNQFYDQPRLLELMIDILFRVAAADGTISSNEEALIAAAARIFGFSDQQYRMFSSRYKSRQRPDYRSTPASEVNPSYAVLGCNPSDSDEQVKKRYRELVHDYHPDKIASKGLPEEFTKFANNKFREIQAAYEAIKRDRGIK